MPHDLTPVRLDALRVGQRLTRALHESSGRKLVGEGVEITPAIRGRLAEMDPLSVGIPETPEVAPTPEETDVRERARRLKRADAIVAERAPLWDRIPRRVTGYAPGRTAPGTPIGRARMVRFRDDRVVMTRRILERIAAGERIAAADPTALIEDLVDAYRAHAPSYGQLVAPTAGTPSDVASHSFAAAALSVGMAMRLAWPHEHVTAVGLAGLLADVGMLVLPVSLRGAARPLTDIEVNRLRRHPAYGVVLLDSVRGLPELVRMAVHQHHERDDGSGYPGGLREARICDHARVVAVADSFAAAIELRPYRPPPPPIDAARELVDLSSRGVIGRHAVRELLHLLRSDHRGDAGRQDGGDDVRRIEVPHHHVLAA